MPIHKAGLPPFASLLAFEAVERLGTFTAAARELRVSQAAVSQRVGELEAWLNLLLVHRNRPRIGFTEDGVAVAKSVRESVESLTAALEGAKRRHDRMNRVTLAATNAFALYWLGSRLQGFYAAHPEIELNLLTADRTVGAERRDFDLGIVNTLQRFEEFEDVSLVAESILAIAAPSYVEGRPADVEAGQWDQETLLNLDSEDETWMSWDEWFAVHGISPAGSLRVERFSSYLTLLQAAVAGRGVALGWRQLIGPLLERGELTTLGSGLARPATPYRLVSRKNSSGPNQRAVGLLHDWLIETARQG